MKLYETYFSLFDEGLGDKYKKAVTRPGIQKGIGTAHKAGRAVKKGGKIVAALARAAGSAAGWSYYKLKGRGGSKPKTNTRKLTRRKKRGMKNLEKLRQRNRGQ